MKKIVLTGGGSAGHTIPNIALIPELKKNYQLFYIGSNGIERELLKNQEVPFYTISCTKLIRGNIFKNLFLPFRYIKSVYQAKQALKQIQPDLVFSKGGYVALPVVKAAKKLKIPIITHESDLSCGLANKFIAKDSKLILTSFLETVDNFKNGLYVGPPLRYQLFGGSRIEGLQQFHFSGNKAVLLIFAGGSGSKKINEAVANCLPALLKEFDILHICGKDCPPSQDGYTALAFIKDMHLAYACADYVLSRAGSNSIFECLALQKPTLFIPLANKRTRGDQVENANYFYEKGLCHILTEEKLDAGSLLQALMQLKQDNRLKENLKENKVIAGNSKIIESIAKILNENEYDITRTH